MREPWFWWDDSLVARCLTDALTPVAALYDGIQQIKIRGAQPYRPAMPVICVGNATLGGSGKTPVALMLARLLAPAYGACAFLSRGYGGSEVGPLLVEPGRHVAAAVGDEPLLLAQAARTVIARDRAEGARFIENLAPAPGAIIMDDGYQNPSVKKDLSVLLLPGAGALGNGRVFPAGPLREPVSRAINRADLAIRMIDQDTTDQVDGMEPVSAAPVFTARLAALGPPPAGPLIAFCGIARPARFFKALEEAGGEIVEKIAFGDHHRFTPQELKALAQKAKKTGAQLITTEKDAARLSAAEQETIQIFRIEIRLDEPDGFLKAATAILDQHKQGSRAP